MIDIDTGLEWILPTRTARQAIDSIRTMLTSPRYEDMTEDRAEGALRAIQGYIDGVIPHLGREVVIRSHAEGLIDADDVTNLTTHRSDATNTDTDRGHKWGVSSVTGEPYGSAIDALYAQAFEDHTHREDTHT